MHLLPMRSRFFDKLGRTSSEQFPNHQLSFWNKVMFYKEFLNQIIYIKAHIQKELLKVLEEKTSMVDTP